MRITITLCFLYLSSIAYASSGITFHGRILRAIDNSSLDSATTEFRIRIKSPGAENCLLWEETQTRDMSASAGVFTLTVGQATVPNTTAILNSSTAANFTLPQVFSNGPNYTGLSCGVGTSYASSSLHGRVIEMSFRETTGVGAWEDLPPTTVNYVPLAYRAVESETLGGRSANEFLKIASYPSQTILSNVQVDTLLGLVNGTDTTYLRPADNFAGDVTGPSTATVVARIRGTNVVATAPTINQVLKFDGTNWVPAADDAGAAPGDASYAAKGVIQINTDQATSGLFIAGGVLALPNVITAAGPVGGVSTIPVITYDQKGRLTVVTTATVDDTTKLPLAGGTMTGPINMGTQNITNATSIAATNFSGRNLVLNDNDTNTATIRAPTDIPVNYALTLPANDGDPGQVLLTDGAGVLTWGVAAAGDITSVVAGAGLITGGTTGDVTLDVGAGTGIIVNANDVAVNVGTGANQIVQLNGSSELPAVNGVNLTNLNADNIASGTLAIARGGTGATTANAALNNLLPNQATFAGRVLTTDGTDTSWVAASAGTVTSVSSTNSYLSVATATTTPALTLNVGTAANTVAAGDDARITGAVQQVAYAADLAPAASCTTAQTPYWNTVSDLWACQAISVTSFSGNLAGDVTGAQGTTVVERIRGVNVVATAPTTGQVLKFDGTNYVPSADLGITAETDPNVQAWAKAAPNAVFTTAGDVLNITSRIPSSAAAPVVGQDGQTLRWNNTSGLWEWFTPGVAGAGITTLNGLTDVTQSFGAIDTATGTAPTWNSVTGVHTLRIPMASAAGVTAGLLNKTDYDLFVEKLTSPLTTKGDLIVHNGATHVRLPAGTDTYLLSANSATASGLEWIAAPAGDITSVVAGAGLITGGTTGDVTLDVGAGTGIIVNANDVAVNVGTGANQIVQLNGSSELPAVSGVNLTNLNADNVASGTLAIARGGTGATTANAALNNLLPNQGTFAGRVLTTDGTNTSWVAASAGTVTSVSSTNSYLSVATATTTPALTLNVGTATNTVAAGDDSRIVNAVQQAAYAADLAPAASCTTAQTPYWNTVSDLWACQNISVNADGLGIFANGGNSFAGAATLGTNDNFALNFETNNTTRMTILNNGQVGIGGAPVGTHTLSVVGGNAIINGVSVGQSLGGTSNTLLGEGALSNNTDAGNTAIGRHALASNTSGQYNTAVGYNSMESNQGTDNVAIGSDTMSAGGSTGSRNTALGNLALSSITSGSDNVGLGRSSGTNITSGTDNIIIGSGANAPSATANFQLNIGNLIYGDMTAASRMLDVNGSVNIRGLASAPSLSSTDNGKIYYDNTDDRLKVSLNGGAFADILTSASATGDITSVVAGAGLITGGTTGDVTLDVGAGTGIIVNANDVAVNVGTGANQIVQLNGSSELPAVSGVNLTNLNADNIASGTLAIARGGTGATTANAALNNLLPSQGANAGRVLATDGTNTSWVAASAGTVTSVSSTNAYLSVATATTTPALTLNIGTAANTVAAGDDSRIVNAVQQAAYAADLAPAASCTNVQTVYWNTVSDLWACQNINFAGSGGFVNGGNSFAGAATLGTNDNFALNFETNNATHMTINTDGKIGMYRNNPSTTDYEALEVDMLFSGGGNNTGIVTGIKSIVRSDNTGDRNIMHGLSSDVQNWSSGTIGRMVGSYNRIRTFGSTGTIPNSIGSESVLENNAGTMTNAIGFLASITQPSGTITNAYGLYVDPLAGTNRWGVYQAGASDNNYFAGNVGIGATAPGAKLQIGTAGTSLGTMRLTGNTSGYVQIQPAAAAGSWNMTLPANDGDPGQVLTTDGSGVLSWTAASAGALNDLTDAVTNYSTTYNFFLGQGVGNGSTAVSNTGVGAQVLQALTTGFDNTAFGHQSLQSLTSGTRNTSIGREAMQATTTGNNNTVVGMYSAANITTGGGNTAVGSGALTSVTVANENAAFGAEAISQTTGGSNVALGFRAGFKATGDSYSNVFLGNMAGPDSNTADVTESLWIHNYEGMPTIYGNFLNRQIGLGGIINPSSTLDVNGAITQRGMAAPAVSPAGQGRIYFDSGTNRFRVSQNGVAYTDLALSGGTFLAGNGTIASPSISFSDDTNTGFYVSGDFDDINVTLGGISAAVFNNTSFNIYRPLTVGNGDSPALPAYSLTDNSSTGTGMYSAGTNIIGFATNGTEKVRISAGGQLSIGNTSTTHAINVTGTAGLSTGTAWTNTSDRRLKDIHGDYEYGLNEILKLNTVRFNYKKNNPLNLSSKVPMTGFIAQEVQSVIPDAVTVRDDGYLELNVDPIHWATVNAVQDLYGMCKAESEKTQLNTQEISTLKRDLASLKDENQVLKLENEQMKKDLEMIKKKLGL